VVLFQGLSEALTARFREDIDDELSEAKASRKYGVA
jgi:hypothetical protein